MKLTCLLPVDRNQTGTLQVFQNDVLIETFPCLGKADNDMAKAKGNPRRDPERPYGDTPVGNWRVRVGVIQRDEHAFGPLPIFVMWPLDGQALKSYNVGRRSQICLHGGKPNAAGGLRPTYGCLRVENKAMARLHELIGQYGQIENLQIKEVTSV